MATVLGSGLALMVLAMPQPIISSPQLYPVQDFDLAALAVEAPVVGLADAPEFVAIDPAREGIKGGQWDEMPQPRWSYRTSAHGPAIELGTGGGRIKPLRYNRPKQRDGRLAHVTLGWDF